MSNLDLHGASASARLCLLASGLAMATAASAQPALPPSVRHFHVVHYTARLEPDLAAKTLRGHVALRFVATVETLNALELDRGDLAIDSVREDGRTLEFAQRARHLDIRLSRAARMNEPREVDIEYHGAPRSGLLFFPDRSQIYTVFSTSQWLVCVNAPDDRSTLDLSVTLPGGLAAVGNGRLVARRTMPNGLVEHEWRQDRPMPTYTFGFAAGHFTDVTEKHGRRRLRYLGDGFSEAELQRVFSASSDMIDFFEDRAGVRYAEATYAQVLVANTIGQEMSGFSVMSEAYGRAVLANAGGQSLGAHELAHQWWGNLVTCRDWTHFWLNEGFATFMAAAYKERHLGRQEYLHDIAASRARYEKIRDAGHDRSLVFPDWEHPTADDRTLVYHKGAYVLHLLREHLGERVFWEGIRHYTRTYFGRSVTTADFQAAMEHSSGKNLADFFAAWIYQTSPR